MIALENKESIVYCFDAFCKKVMRFEARNRYKEIDRRERREISLEYLMETQYFAPNSIDSYFVEPDMPTDFYCNGHIITIENGQLAMALLSLPEERQDLILRYYFLHIKEKDLAVMYSCNRRAVSYRLCRTRELLRKEMERYEHEEL